MGKKRNNLGLSILLLLLLFWLVFVHPSSGIAVQPDWDFFKGKVITYIVATKPGGGYDAYARLIVRSMEKYIPGSTIIVKNIPGAGHIIGANELYVSKPDGLTIGTFNTGLIYSQIVGQPGIKFDLKKYTWIGKAASDVRVLIASTKSPYKTFQDLKKAKEPMKLGTAGAGSAAYNETAMLADALELNLKRIPGYDGREAEMAQLRGEIDGQIASWSALKYFVKMGEARVLIQFGGKRHPELPDVPLGSELVGPKGKAIVDLVGGIFEVARFTAAPPGLPEGRTMVLIEAYKKALTDPELIKQAEKMDFPIDPLYGEKVAQLITAAVNQPKENVEMLKKIIKIE